MGGVIVIEDMKLTELLQDSVQWAVWLLLQ
jgi:hypothetical protein